MDIFWEKTMEISIFLLVILVPLVFYRHCTDMFSPLKELVFEILTAFLLMIYGFKIINSKRLIITRSPLDFPILSFMAICTLSLFWSNSFPVSLKELPLFLAGPFLYFIVTNQFKKSRQIKIDKIILIVLLVGSLSGIYGLIQYQGIDFFFQISKTVRAYKIMGILGNANYFAEYLVIILPLAISLFFVTSSKIKKILLLIGILAMGGSLMLTFTRSSYFGFGVSLIFMFSLFLRNRGKQFIKENKKIFILILAAILLIGFLFVIPNPLNKPGTYISKIKDRTSITTLKNEFTSGRRTAIWKFTAMMIGDHPLLGSGIGTFKYNSLSYQAEFFKQGDNRSIYPHGFAKHVHNEYSQLCAELGIIGLGIFIWIMICYFYYACKILKETKDKYQQGMVIGLMGSILAVLIDAIFGFSLHLPATLVLFWLFLGITMNINPEIVISSGNKDHKIEQNRKGMTKEKKSKQTKSSIKRGRVNLNRACQYKRIFGIIIILLLFLFLSVTLARPFIAQIYLYYGNIEVRKRDEDRALDIYKKSLKYDPYFGRAAYSVGKVLKNKRLYDDAQEYLERAEKTYDIHTLPLDLALVYYYQGKFDKAAEKFEKAIHYQLNEKSMVPIYTDLGTTYYRLGKDNLAKDAYQNALKIEPNFVRAHFALSQVYFRQNLQHEAVEELRTVIRLAPDSKEAKRAGEIIHKLIPEEGEKE
jgi:O-antigen ligase/Tfp pilus assembly protein PilF